MRHCNRYELQNSITRGMPHSRPTGAKPEVLPRDKQTCQQCGALVFGERWHIRKDGKDLLVCSLCYAGRDKKALFCPGSVMPEIEGHPGDVWARAAGFVAGWVYSHPELYHTPDHEPDQETQKTTEKPGVILPYVNWHDHATEQTRIIAAKLVALYEGRYDYKTSTIIREAVSNVA